MVQDVCTKNLLLYGSWLWGCNYWEDIGMVLNLRKFRPQLQEIIIFTCNPIKDEDTRHELPKEIYNPKQDRKILQAQIIFKGMKMFYEKD